MNRPFARILFALAAIGVFAGDPDPEAARKAVEEGDAARAKGDLWDAIYRYSSAIAADPSSPTPWHRRGLARRLAGEFDKAIDDLEKAVDLDPSAPGAHNDLGLAKADTDDLAGAIASYDTALRLAPDSALTWNNRSFAKRLTGDFDGALKDATMALQIDPKYARAYLNRGLCLYDLREWEDALADLEKSVELEAAGQDFTRLRIWILRTRLGKKEAADKRLREWLKERKATGDWTESLGKFLLGDEKEPCLAAGRDLKSGPDARRMAEYYFFVGSKLLVTGDLEKAKLVFRAARDPKLKNLEVMRSIEAELEPLLSPTEK